MKYIIIQAGGKGSRLGTLTNNKPKCLVPVNNLPIVFHLFKKYPKSKFIIIADYKKEVLKKYLKTFAKDKYRYTIIETKQNGTCSGISKSLKLIPAKKPFMLIWCDLILLNKIHIPKDITDNYICTSNNFECSWSYHNNSFKRKKSKKHGIIGLFLFKNKKELKQIPSYGGEFVFWLSQQKLQFKHIDIPYIKEIGTIFSYCQNELNKPKNRSFNKIEFDNHKVIKNFIEPQGIKLSKYEISWYKEILKINFQNIPKIYKFKPLVMEKIEGKNIYFYSSLAYDDKKVILKKIIDTIHRLHYVYNTIPCNKKDCYDIYIKKTFTRLEKVRDLIPFAKDENIIINGEKYVNIFAIKDKILKVIKKYYPKNFNFIHGDCTFSNIILKTDETVPILIDPRGYFGKTKYYGDTDYDWAKLYYSIVGNYDQFNHKNFHLNIKNNSVDLQIISNKWENCDDYFFTLISKKDNVNKQYKKEKIKLLHALIWLSLTTYTWEDYDSICGAFYNGLIYLKDYLDETK